MSENPFAITLLNDFIFCPASIYFHMLEDRVEKMTYQSPAQLNGTAAHEKSDSGHYSLSGKILQGMPVYPAKFGLAGKIDVFDTTSGLLTERKRKIKTVYDGYIFQMYGQFYALTEMGYSVRSMRLYSMSDNKSYPLALPADDPEMDAKFRKTIDKLREFDPDSFVQENKEKCANCIYAPMCAFALEE